VTARDTLSVATALDRMRGSSLLTVVGADAVNANIVLPVLPFLAGRLGAGPFLVGLIFAAFSIAQLLAAPLWGVLADRYCIKRLIALALLTGAAGNLLFGLSSTYPMLLLGRIVAGFGAANTLLAEAHVAATIDRANRTARLGRIGAVQGVGTVLGPVLGSVLIRDGNVLVGLGAFGISLTTLAFTAIVLPAARNPDKDHLRRLGRTARMASLAAAVRVRQLRRLAVLVCVAWGCFAGFAAVLPLYLEHHLGMTAIGYGYVLAVSGVVAFTIRGLLLGRLTRKYGEHRLMIIGASCIGMSMVATLAVPSVSWAALLPFLYALGASIFFPSLMTETTARAPHGAMGSVVGGISMASSMGVFSGPLLLGALSEFAGQPSPFMAGGLVLLGMAVLAPGWLRRGCARRAAESSPA
jgi:MFS family permease